jgi:molybdenum cofactor cytidylyltransferase
MITGILLAAGFSRRFGPADKLMHALDDGQALALAAARNLIRVVPISLAVVRPDNTVLVELLTAAGFEVVYCAPHELEMANSLTAAIRHSDSQATGYIVALADMPYIQPTTIASVVDALEEGAVIARPVYRQQPGHPVGFSARLRGELESLSGDEGARSIIARYRHEVRLIECDDPGILKDVDTLADLR